MWLNGQTQWEDHRIGKKHRNRFKKFGGGEEVKKEAVKKFGGGEEVKVPKATVWLMEHDAAASAQSRRAQTQSRRAQIQSFELDEMD